MGCNRFRGEFQWGRLSRGYLHGPDLYGGVGNTDDSVAAPANPARICPPPIMRGEISLQGPPAASSVHPSHLSSCHLSLHRHLCSFPKVA
jgi:hypothetical protein